MKDATGIFDRRKFVAGSVSLLALANSSQSPASNDHSIPGHTATLPQWPAIWLISSALADPSRWHAEVLVGEIEPPMAHEARPRVENYPIAAAVLC